MLLSDYVTQTQLLLHDRNGVFYQTSDLTSYINTARNRVVQDTGCLRSLVSWNTVVSQEVYPFSTFTPLSQTVIDVLNINLYFGNTRYSLAYLPWTLFNARMRFWQNFVQRPTVFSVYGQASIYLGPVPDQIYAMESDVVVLPAPLVNQTDAETLNSPFTSPVKFYAAYLAKMYEQSYNDAEMFKQNYRREIQDVIASIQTRRILTPYQAEF